MWCMSQPAVDWQAFAREERARRRRHRQAHRGLR